MWSGKFLSSQLLNGFMCIPGAFLLTPSHELSMERAAMICEKMNFKGCFSLTKTATGILFKFSNPEDYQATYKKGFHKVTGARFYRKVPVPCRPQKTVKMHFKKYKKRLHKRDGSLSFYSLPQVYFVCVWCARRFASGRCATLVVSFQFSRWSCALNRSLSEW